MVPRRDGSVSVQWIVVNLPRLHASSPLLKLRMDNAGERTRRSLTSRPHLLGSWVPQIAKRLVRVELLSAKEVDARQYISGSGLDNRL